MKASSLSNGAISDVARDWGNRWRRANFLSKPSNLYCGRSFKEAHGAAEELQAELVIISAGLGFVRQQDEVPSYSLTVSNGRKDSIKDKIIGPKFSPNQWWQALGSNTDAVTSLDKILRETKATLVLLSLSENYARMLSSELSGLKVDSLRRVRIFGAGLATRLPSQVAATLMPYDARLNGTDSPVRGTMTDFAPRALHHYSNCIQSGLIDGSSVESDRLALSKMMRDWSFPEIPKRERLSDSEVINFISENWEATEGKSGFTLRFLRDSGFACEQSRFKSLFHEARERRTLSAPKLT